MSLDRIMRVAIPAVSTAVLLFYLALAYVPPKQREILRDISKRITRGEVEIALTDVIPGDWDRVCVLMEGAITPTTTREELEQLTDATWAGVSRLPNMEGHRLIPRPHTRLMLAIIGGQNVIQTIPFSYTSAKDKSDASDAWLQTEDYKTHCFNRAVKIVRSGNDLTFMEK